MSYKIVEHKYAYFEDKKGMVHKYHFSKLKNEELFASLKDIILTDKSGLLKLTPRKHQTTPHFKEISENTNKIFFTSDSEYHDNRIEEILNELNNINKKKVILIKTVKSSDYSFKAIPLIKINNYLWNSEVVCTYKGENNFRHDLSGFDFEGSQTKSKPKVIIEIIDTHFIEKEVYNSLIERSVEKDLLILFYILPTEPKYNNITANEIKISCYIKNGKFYYGNKILNKIKNSITKETSNEYAEFFYVKEFVIGRLKKEGKYVDLKMFK